jgi:hypothetical protein
MAGKRSSDQYDHWVGELATVQHGVVAWWQLRDAGIPRAFVDTRLARGRLHIIHRGVYGVGHPVLGREGRYLAAVLALGPTAVLSHYSAAAHWGILPPRDGGPVHVSLPLRRAKQRDGIRVHCPVAAFEEERVGGIPVTTVAHTLLDLADVADRATLGQAVEGAERARVFDLEAIRRASASGRGGCRALSAAIAWYREAPTRSELERRFLVLCADHGIERPLVNTTVAGFVVDFVWPEQRLVVETDGHAWHSRTDLAAERDRRRDAALTLAGYRTQRFTWRQVVDEPALVVAVLRSLLAAWAA